MDKRENTVGFLIRKLSKALRKKSERFVNVSCEHNRLTMVQRWILGYLANNDDHDIFQHELEKQLNIGKSTLTEVLHLLEKNELVRREVSKEDGRCKKIVLTDKARQIDRQITEDIKAVEAQMREGISDEEYEWYLKLTKKMIENISKDMD